jgi:uncharacterized membrane protein
MNQIESAKRWAMVVYALQAASFLIPLCDIAAVVIAYLKLPEGRGNWVETHYLWQIRTFWFSLMGFVVGAISLMWLAGYIILIATVLWMVYRIAVGWTRLSQNRPAYPPESLPPPGFTGV